MTTIDNTLAARFIRGQFDPNYRDKIMIRNMIKRLRTGARRPGWPDLIFPPINLWNAPHPPISKRRMLKITQCHDPLKWYAGLIDQTVPYLGDMGDEYKTRQPDGYVNFVAYEDAEIVESAE